MLARISTTFNCTAKTFWTLIDRPASLQFVTAPILSFRPLAPPTLDKIWAVDKVYEFKLYLFKVLPLGRHQIELVTLDRTTNTIVSNERGTLAPTWNHTIRFEHVAENRIRYTDEIAITAGWRTAFIWLFAQLFYRHRQRRWKMLLKR